MNVSMSALSGHMLKLVVCAAFGAAFGGFELYRGLQAREIKPVDLRAVETGGGVSGSWLRVRGRALWDETCAQSGDGRDTYFVPVVSEAWRPGDPVALFLLYRRKDAEPAPSGVADVAIYEGTSVWWWLQALGRRPKERLHALGLREADNYFLLSEGEKPRGLVTRGLTGLGIAALALAAIPLVRRWEGREGP